MSMTWWLMLSTGFVSGLLVGNLTGWGACKVAIHWRTVRRAAHVVRGTAFAAFWAVVTLVVVAMVGLTHFGAFG